MINSPDARFPTITADQELQDEVQIALRRDAEELRDVADPYYYRCSLLTQDS